MELKGKHKVEATVPVLWNILMDTQSLSKIVPGVTKLERTGENTYSSELEIRMGPMAASFTGNAQMEDIMDHRKFTLKMQQSNKMGNANSVMKVELLAITESETEVIFEGELKITGLLASMGKNILSSAANVLTRQFFANLDHELAKQKAVHDPFKFS